MFFYVCERMSLKG